MSRDATVTLAVDVPGFARLKARDRAAALRVWGELDQTFNELLARYQGNRLNIVTEASYLAIFPRALEAVAYAVALQQAIGRLIQAGAAGHFAGVRIAVTANARRGEGSAVLVEDDGSAMLLAGAAPGGLCISRRVYDEVQEQLGPPNGQENDYPEVRRLWGSLQPPAPPPISIGATDLAGPGAAGGALVGATGAGPGWGPRIKRFLDRLWS